MSEHTVKTIHANGVEFAYLEAGEGPLVLCLHGFPDTAYSFSEMLVLLAEQGFRAVVPFMRGYYPSGFAPDGDYSVLALAEDVLALIEALGFQKATVIGHDWGAMAAYTAANLQTDCFDKLVLMCVPHMHSTKMSWAQMKKSWYVFYFQLAWLPERQLPRGNYQFIDRLYREWSPNWNPKDFALGPLKRAMAEPGGLKAMLAYYRAMIRGSSKYQREVMARQTSVPTLYFAGEADGSVGMDQFENTEQAFTESYEFVSYPGVGHFPHRENFPAYSAKVIQFLKT